MESTILGPRRVRGARAGFTLIEVLVVVAIIALLVSILLPSLAAARRQGKEVVCKSNLHQIGIASGGYASMNKRGTFPDWWAVGTSPFRALPGYYDAATGKYANYGLPDTLHRLKLIPLPSKVWICPLNERDAQYKQTYFWANFDRTTQDTRSYNAGAIAGATTSGNTGTWWVADNYNLKPYRPVDERPEYDARVAASPDNREWFHTRWPGPGKGSLDVGWRYWHRGASSKWHATKGGEKYGWGFNMLFYDLSLGFRAMSKSPVE